MRQEKPKRTELALTKEQQEAARRHARLVGAEERRARAEQKLARLEEKVARLEQREHLVAGDGVAVELDGRRVTVRRGLLNKKSYEIDETVSAAVDTAGNFARRPTLTRAVAGGLVAGPIGAIVGSTWRKKEDKREVYLLIEGADWAELVELKPKSGAAARRVAQKINLVARAGAETPVSDR